ncbi:MAG TPA: acetylornithine/succinylornithine family transaminase [Actinomycetota bacterium]|nr:acetylornithine/succinylornithine family transaminase [Actinomycetota bacterium]
MSSLMANYRRFDVVLERGEGSWLYDTEGRRYLDWLAGIGVNVLGHAHPAVVAAIREQAGVLVHTSNLFHTPQGAAAAEAVAGRLGGGSVFFCNSGAEAVEAALKLARRRAWRAGEADRFEVVCVQGSFHGRTYGALAATMQPAKQEGFGPLPAGFVSVPPNDLDALRAAVSERTCAILFEPVLGEGGVLPVERAWAQTARALADEHGALVVCDEVQTGVGRTGRWWGFEHLAIRPDAVTLAKALGGGLPVGALWVDDPHSEVLQPGDHATTFGGGPLVCAVVRTVLETVDRSGLVERAAQVGERIRRGLSDLGAVRGHGLLLALDLGEPVAREVVERALSAGLIVNDVSPTAIRLAPPLVLTDDEAETGIDLLRRAVAG